MHIVLVHIHVKENRIEEFIQETSMNANGSIQEEGIIRFDFLQQTDNPTQFTLIEVYLSPEDQQKHRETPHYLRWKDAVGEMMAEPRQGIKYKNILPSDSGWNK